MNSYALIFFEFLQSLLDCFIAVFWGNMDGLTSTLKAVNLAATPGTVNSPWSRTPKPRGSHRVCDRPGMSPGRTRANPIELDDDGARPGIPLQTPDREILDPRPAYHDEHFDCIMYRGPGYEDFPVALVSNPAYQKVVDEWDKQNLHRERRKFRQQLPMRYPGMASTLPTTLTSPSGSSGQSDPATNNARVSSSGRASKDQENACLARTLQVFPNIDHEFVRKKYKEWYKQLSQVVWARM